MPNGRWLTPTTIDCDVYSYNGKGRNVLAGLVASLQGTPRGPMWRLEQTLKRASNCLGGREKRRVSPSPMLDTWLTGHQHHAAAGETALATELVRHVFFFLFFFLHPLLACETC